MVKYVMSKEMAEFLMTQRKGDEKKMKRDDYLKKVINQQFCLRGECVEVTIV